MRSAIEIIRAKAPCTNSLSIVNCSRGLLSGGFCPGVFCLEGFVRGGFCLYHLLSEYICYNRKLKITLNFMFHMYDKKFISVTSHALDPIPVTLSRTPSPSSVTYFMDGPIDVAFVKLNPRTSKSTATSTPSLGDERCNGQQNGGPCITFTQERSYLRLPLCDAESQDRWNSTSGP